MPFPCFLRTKLTLINPWTVCVYLNQLFLPKGICMCIYIIIYKLGEKYGTCFQWLGWLIPEMNYGFNKVVRHEEVSEGSVQPEKKREWNVLVLISLLMQEVGTRFLIRLSKEACFPSAIYMGAFLGLMLQGTVPVVHRSGTRL